MRKAVFPGSFDPVTLGHLHLIERAARLYDEVIVVIAVNSAKNALFSIEERKALLMENLRSAANVRVDVAEGLLVDKVRQLGADVMLRGVRDVQDLPMRNRSHGPIMSWTHPSRRCACLPMRATVRSPARSSVSLHPMGKMFPAMYRQTWHGRSERNMKRARRRKSHR